MVIGVIDHMEQYVSNDVLKGLTLTVLEVEVIH